MYPEKEPAAMKEPSEMPGVIREESASSTAPLPGLERSLTEERRLSLPEFPWGDSLCLPGEDS